MKGISVIFMVLSALIWHAAAAKTVNETALVDAFSKIPSCGQTCILSSIAESECKTFTNTTCLCTSQQVFDLTLDCLLSSCNTTDALLTAKLETDACQKPQRNKKAVLLAPLSIELLGLVCVIVRLYSRWRFTPRYEIDDWVMLFCTVLYIPFEVIGHYTGQIAFGVDVWEVDTDTISYGFLLFYIDESFYLVILVLTKVSMLLFYMRIFPQQWFRRACLACIAWIAVSGLIFLCMEIFQCWPLNYAWLGWKGGYSGKHTCLNVNALSYTAAGFSIAQDVVILAIPVPLLAHLNASVRKRSQILFMFSLGFFVLLTSCIRLGFIVHFAATWNPTWDYSGPLIWSGLELGVSMIVTSLPAIRVLLTRTMPGAFGGGGSRDTTAGSGGSLPLGFGFSHHRSGGVGYANSKSRQWTGFSSHDRTRLDDESEVELATREDTKEPPPSAPEIHRHRSIRTSVLSSLSRNLG